MPAASERSGVVPMTEMALYTPINVPKPVADGVWVVDGPIIPMRIFGVEMPFPTRMTVVRLAGGGLWLHSPIAPDDGLVAALDGLGPVAHLVAPNTIHYWWMAAWQRRFPQAVVHAVPSAARRARRKGRPFRVDRELVAPPAPGCPAELDELVVAGSYLTEAVFHHRPTRTLILTDLVQNYEKRRLRGAWLLLLLRIGGVRAPHGSMPRDMRLTFLGRHRDALRRAVRQMIEWRPERVILAHGKWYASDGTAALRRAFAFLSP